MTISGSYSRFFALAAHIRKANRNVGEKRLILNYRLFFIDIRMSLNRGLPKRSFKKFIRLFSLFESFGRKNEVCTIIFWQPFCNELK